MAYSIDRIHEPKFYHARRQGKTVDAVADVIGKVMVTKTETIYFVIRLSNRERHIARELEKMCVELYGEKLVKVKQSMYMIEGYSSKIVFITSERYRNMRGFHSDILPTYDLD